MLEILSDKRLLCGYYYRVNSTALSTLALEVVDQYEKIVGSGDAEGEEEAVKKKDLLPKEKDK